MKTRDTMAVAVAVVVMAGACSNSGTKSQPGPRPTVGSTGSPAALVDTFMGTGVGGEAVGNVNTSPAAAVPFGMMEWGPDTAPTRAAGNFPPGPAFTPSPLPNIGQDGWEEGNSIQYTWSVPQDVHGLFTRMGGNGAAIAKLDSFFTALNTSRKQPHDWAGNEPALGIPWEYDYAGAPWRTQDVVRRIATQLYAPTPDGEPGNDDLGALSSWYVWAAIGLYPETPGRADLVLASPLFTGVTVQLASGKTITITAPDASATNRYVHELRVGGVTAPAQCLVGGGNDYTCPWLPASVVATGAQLAFTLSAVPDEQWATAPGAAPPSISAPSSG